MANHMKEVAKLLGVELNEEFEVDYGKGNTATAKITQTGLHIISTSMIFYGDINRATLDWLLGGVCTIKRKPWKPHIGESYWYTDGHHVFSACYQGAIHDWNAYKLGNCYRDQKSAEADREKWIEFYASDEVLEV